jgi:glycosyltransferase involved in cell wall biosynthesis
MKFMKLSIIIPFYQNIDALSSCLASLAKQTIFDLYNGEVEVIVVDDGSETETRNQKPEIRDWNIEFYKIEHSGAPAARNFGWQKSSGEYVFFCDADVVFLKNDALEKMIKVLDENKNKAFCYSRFKFGWKKFSCYEFNAEELKKNNYISTMSLIRREWLQKLGEKPWDESLKKFQDWDLWLSIVERGGEGILIPKYLWRARTGGMSKWLPGEKFNFYKFLPWFKDVKKFEEAKKIVMEKHKLL